LNSTAIPSEMKIKYTINGIGFTNNKSVEQHAREILYNHAVNSHLQGDDETFMREYFRNFHIEWVQKVGTGIQFIRRIAEPNYGKHRGFEIIREDGSSTDISFIISKISKRDFLQDFKAALRIVIEPQVFQFKKVFFDNPQILKHCELTGETITFGACHVDHYTPTFGQLAQDFIEFKCFKALDFERLVAPPADNQTFYKLIDDDVANEFYNFHETRARLRVLSVTGNLSLAKRNRV